MTDPSPLAQTIDYGRESGMNLLRITAASQVTIGLHALARNPGPIQPAQIEAWEQLLNTIRTMAERTLVIHDE